MERKRLMNPVPGILKREIAELERKANAAEDECDGKWYWDEIYRLERELEKIAE